MDLTAVSWIAFCLAEKGTVNNDGPPRHSFSRSFRSNA